MATDYSRQEVLGIIQKEAQERGIPKDDFLRFAYIETGGKFDEQANRGPNGAKGLFQFVPSTAAEYGIAGRELDAVANTDAAARLYLDNKRSLTTHHDRTGDAYLSGRPSPNGLDMYLAHQQGFTGYKSIQDAISDGSFTHPKTRANILNNVSSDDVERITGMTKDEFRKLPDKQMAENFVKYWDTKYQNISIPEVGVKPLSQGGQGQSPGGGGQSPKPTDPMADGVLERGEKGPAVKSMQEQLIKAGITQVNGKPFTADSDYGPQTEAAVREYQRTRGLKVDGEAGPNTLEALKNNMPPKTPGAPDQTQGNGVNWPAPGNYKINDADKPGEGHGEFGTSRGGGVRTHKGVDIEGKVGDPIESFRPGTVVAVKPNNGSAGNMVVIDHGGGVTSTYMHLDKIHAKVGQKVPEDIEVIGTMGRTGNTPKAGDTHLHFEIRKDGVAVDPMPYLKGAKELDGPGKPSDPAAPLKQGDKGASVEQLQTRLNDLGYTDAAGNKLKPDSDFGGRTKQAVEQFQRENGLNVTGVADKDTMRLVDKGMTRHAAADGDLKPGEKGPDVRGFQTNLNELGFKGADGKPLKVDGEYGGNTQAAVSAFQKANGLPETGVADKATLDRVGQQVKLDPKVDVDGRVTGVVPPGTPRTEQTTNQPVVNQPVVNQPVVNPPATERGPLINDAKHPDNKMYTQAVSTLEQMGPSGGFKSRDELERAAAALAADAKLTGLTQIDHVTRSKNGEGLIAIQGLDPWASDAKRAFIDTNQATNQSIDQSTKMADTKQPEPIRNQEPSRIQDAPQDESLTTKPRTMLA